MGVFGAMQTAITGLRAQATALGHISNNIANSQTVGYKRSDTTFSDLVPGSPARQQALGVVQAFSRPTNTVQGDITKSEVRTFMGINGDGYFIVGAREDTVDGLPVFSDEALYTRRGDFELDRNGYLVNGAGYYLKGLDINPATGNVNGSVPDFVQVTNDFLPASATTQIEYQANLAATPKTSSYDPAVPNSELLAAGGYAVDPRASGAGVVQAGDNTLFLSQTIAGGAVTAHDALGASVDVQFRWAKLNVPTVASGTVDISGDLDNISGLGLTPGDQLTLTIGTETFTIGFNTTGAPGAGEDAAIDLLGADDADGGAGANADATGTDLVNAINALFTGTPAALNGSNQLEITSSTNEPVVFAGSDATVLSDLGLDTIGVGGATTQTVSSPDTWNLFYLSNSAATGAATQWTNVGQDYTFNAQGALNPSLPSVTITGLTVNGVALGNIPLIHGAGISQFADSSGSATITDIDQNGSAAGEFSGISVSEEGRIIASYTNGRVIEVAEVTLASFLADGFLEKADGNAFRRTIASGNAILGSQGKLVGAALEASNSDIADEFSKLIVTQQAYAANTRVISTGEEMLQEVLNMLR